jgi:hypothetical protein
MGTENLTIGLGLFPESAPAALTLDVRKVSDLPRQLKLLWGFAPIRAQPSVKLEESAGGAEPPPHIRRHSRETNMSPQLKNRFF